MLRRRSIRTKLVVAVALLSAIALLLAFSSFWGLYRYRQLADAVGRRAAEIPLAHELNKLALTLSESYSRSVELRRHRGMINAVPLSDSIFDMGAELAKHENDRFNDAMFEFEQTLDSYESKVVATSTGQTLLLDNMQQGRKLGEIREMFDQLHRARTKPKLTVNEPNQLAHTLDQLVQRTEEHQAIILDGMTHFSGQVRSQYAAWMGMTLTCTILAISMVCILLWSFHSLVVKPFQTLLAGSWLVAGGQFDHRIDLGTGDELSELADAMNGMTDRFQGALAKVNAWCTDLDRQVQQRTREVIQNEQLASVGYLAAGVAHEINNPLATIAWSAESLQSRVAEMAMVSTDDRQLDEETCEALVTNLRRIEEEAYRCKGITEKLLDFSRLSEVRRVETDLVTLVEDVVEMVGKVGKYRCKTLRTHAQAPVLAQVNSQEIRQVVLNLVTNALESVACDGAVDVYVDDDGTCGAVIVKDDGCGMSTDVLTHLFEPFFTRRRDGTGTGLGLSISYRIVSQHGGSLLAKSDGEGCGSEMQMLLPLTPAGEDDGDPNLSTIGLSALGTRSRDERDYAA